MAQAYFSLVTNTGKIKLANSAAGGDPIVITHFAIGDGNGAETNPTAASTSLVREVWRTPVESVVVDPDNPSAVLVTAIIPTDAGGWWMREFGIFDHAGDMIAVAKPVSQYKPTALEGQLEDIRYEFQIIIGENANVTLLVDPSVLLASRQWVMSRRIPMAQLNRLPWLPINSMTTTAPPAVPVLGDVYLVPDGATGAWAAHIGKIAEWVVTGWQFSTPPNGHAVSLPDGRVFQCLDGKYAELLASATRSGLVELATNAEVQTGTDIARAVTPAGLASRTATDARAGIVELATAAEALAGTDATRAITPATLRSLFTGGGNLGTSGYQKLPGGLIMQWGSFSGQTTAENTLNGVSESGPIGVNWPIAFPNALLQVVAGCGTDVGGVGQQEQAWFSGFANSWGTARVAARQPGVWLTGSFIVFGY